MWAKVGVKRGVIKKGNSRVYKGGGGERIGRGGRG